MCISSFLRRSAASVDIRLCFLLGPPLFFYARELRVDELWCKSGEGATTTPSMLTPYFGKVKGRAEASLLSLSQTSPYTSLRPFSVRPGGIDPSGHSGILPFIPQQQGMAKQLLLPIMKTVYSNMHSPAGDLARVLVDLAMSDGKELKGDGVSGDGRTLANKAMRRLAGI